MTKIGDLIRLDPEHHGGIDSLAVVLCINESMATVPRELTIHIQGVDGVPVSAFVLARVGSFLLGAVSLWGCRGSRCCRVV